MVYGANEQATIGVARLLVEKAEGGGDGGDALVWGLAFSLLFLNRKQNRNNAKARIVVQTRPSKSFAQT